MENNAKKIAAFGDSILKGVVSSDENMFDIIPDSSLPLAAASLGFDFIDESVYGSTITKTFKRLGRFLRKGGTCDIAIIESGSNDSDYDWTSAPSHGGVAKSRVELDEFIGTLADMVAQCRLSRITPVVMNIIPLVNGRWFEHICMGQDREKILAFLDYDPMNISRRHSMYAERTMEFCMKNNVQVVDMRKEFISRGNYDDLMCDDGIHPNKDGYRFMADVWIRELPRVKLEFPVV